MTYKRLLLTLLFFTAIFTLAPFARPAQAQDNTIAISWEDLGLGTKIRFRGAVISQDVFVPIPAGLKPQSIQGKMYISPDVTGGFLEVRNRDRLLGTYPLEDLPKEITIPLGSAQVEGDLLPLTFIVRLHSAEDICIGGYAGRWMEITNPIVHFQGTPQAPQTVGSFLPNVLHQLYIAVPQNPTAAEAQAALTLSTALSRKYHAPGLEVHILTLDEQGRVPKPKDASLLFSRIIAIQETEDAKARVALKKTAYGLPVLWLTGSAQEIETQSQWLVNEWARAAQAATADGIDMMLPQEVGRSIVLLADLQPQGWSVEGLGQLDLPFHFSQADLGGPVKGLTLHVAGTYTPLQPNAQASLSIYFNDGLVSSQILDQSGKFDFRITLPNMLLQRDNTLIVRFVYTPPNGNCPLGAHPFAATLDKGSYLAVSLGDQETTGFERYPQTLVPEFVVALDPIDVDTLQAAVALTSEWQRMSRRPLQPQLLPWEAAVTSPKPVVLITRQAQRADELHAPVRAEPFRVLDTNGREIFRFDLPTKLAVAETFPQHGRDVFLIVAPSPRQPTQVADAVLQAPNGWYGLQGDTLVISGSDNPVALNVQGEGVRIEPLASTGETWWRRWLPAFYLGGILLILLAAAWLYPRLVRRGVGSSEKQS